MPKWDSVTGFMKTIRNQDLVVMIITEEYLKSQGCMFEVAEILKDEKWVDKCMPCVVSELHDFYDQTNHVQYYNYWEKQEKKVTEAIDKIKDPASKVPLINKLSEIRAIRASLPKFLETVADRLIPSKDEMLDEIYDYVNKNALSIIRNEDSRNGGDETITPDDTIEWLDNNYFRSY